MGRDFHEKIVIGILILLVLATSYGCLKLFVIGEPTDGNTLAVQVEEGDGQITIYIKSTDSALAISNIQYRYEGTVMHLTVWKVLSSPPNRDGDKCLYYQITDETEIWAGGKRIWTAE